MKNTRLAQARLGACRRWPAATSAILSLIPVERRGLGTLAADAHWRLYFDPEYLARVQDAEAELVILHEVSHLLLRHHERGGAATDWELWNFATDCSINHQLQAEGHQVPPDWLLPSRFQLPDNKTAEQYYRLLQDRTAAAKQPDQSSNESAKGQPAECDDVESGKEQSTAATQDQATPAKPGTSGSCSDGRQRPWEDPTPCTDSQDHALPPAMPQHEQDQVLRDVAERIAKQAGIGAGRWSTWAQEIISPRIDPKALLIAAVRQVIEQTSGGHDDSSYRRPSRRPSIGNVIRPSRVDLVPRILLIIDSSGSMNQTDLGLALGLVSKVLSGFRLRDGVHVVVGDTCAQSTQKVFDAKKVEIIGRGGTDVGAIMQQAYDSAVSKPQLILAVTDGLTPWPSSPLPVPVVACLTREGTRSSVPSWIKSVVLA